MFSWLGRLASACLRPVRRYGHISREDEDTAADDELLWYRELDRHSLGEFSIAVVQGNHTLEDHSRVETSHDATFVGVYDGHGGPDASHFVCDYLFLHLTRLAQENGTMSEDVLRNAFSATEDQFFAHVSKTYQREPLIAAVGSCCLVGVIWRGTLYVANLGDSRAIIGCLGRSNNIVAEQLTKDHNASMEEVRQELMSSHPDDSNIVVLKEGIWRVKGIIQVSRSIGDAYLKKSEFSLDESFPRFHLSEPLVRPVLTAEPSICTRVIRPQDKFLIFASDGLWEHMTNQVAAEIVYNFPRAGIARRLIITALNEAAKKSPAATYNEVKKFGKGLRRYFHDDITVVVIFIDKHELLRKRTAVADMSVRGFIDTVGPSDFSVLEGIDVNSSSTQRTQT